ncbi:MAG: phthalate 4,5-dioxygenase oxygenase subunit [Gammaproteobacteria bacterium]|jgi:phthalate 4,5-dioxygenase oxygenase subunit
MLQKKQNDLITQTGPGTPMGDVYRCYWIPALLAEELPEPDCAPVRVQLLSEFLVAFRDSKGRLGLVDEFCAHRCVSLWFGRNEDNGLRCPYHGWKFDVTGQCIDVPSESEDFCKNIKLTAYSLVEKGGILWAYMGDADNKPPLPEYEFCTLGSGQKFISKRYQESNWLQAMEGGIDSSHVSFLHSGNLEHDPLFKGTAGNKYNVSDLKPVFEVVDNPGGLLIGARRNAEDNQYYWRITPWLMPSFTMVPPRGNYPVHGHFWIPIDDTHCYAWSFDYTATRDLTEQERWSMQQGKGVHCEYVPGTFIPKANRSNDYLMNREAQKMSAKVSDIGGTYSGVEGIAIQDGSLQESMVGIDPISGTRIAWGGICDRSKEILAPTDQGIMLARRKIFKAIDEFKKLGKIPPGVDPDTHKVRSASVLLQRDKSFKEAAKKDMRVTFDKPHASI